MGLARPLFIAGGAVSLGLGALGAVLPGLPTTPFVLLAAWCFSKSHPEWHERLRKSRAFGKTVRDWEARGAIAPRAKLLASAVMAALAACALASESLPGPAKAAVIAVQAAVLAFILTRPPA